MKTLVLGASTRPTRYAYLAAQRLLEHGHEIVLLGRRAGMLYDIPIHTEALPFEGIDTVTLYLNPDHQKEYYDYLISLQPRRIIFNPGTENHELATLAQQHGILTEEACTLVLLQSEQY